MISKKICVIGESAVGKKSLIRRFVECQFSDDYLATVGVNIARKTIEFQGVSPSYNLVMQLLIWSITGHPKFQAFAPTYLRGSSGAIAVADITRPETIERLLEHIQRFLTINPKAFIIVALNKCDLIEPEKLSQINNLGQGLKIYPTSAKTGLYVDELFVQVAHRIIELYNDDLSPLPIFFEYRQNRKILGYNKSKKLNITLSTHLHLLTQLTSFLQEIFQEVKKDNNSKKLKASKNYYVNYLQKDLYDW